MKRINWSDHFLIGDSEIDDQHKTFFKLVHDYQDNEASSDADKLLDLFINYAVKHFSYEMNLMKRVGYDAVKMIEHGQHHTKITEALLRMKMTSKDKRDCLLEVVLGQWLINHILTYDLNLASWLKTNRGYQQNTENHQK